MRKVTANISLNTGVARGVEGKFVKAERLGIDAVPAKLPPVFRGHDGKFRKPRTTAEKLANLTARGLLGLL